VGTHTQRRDHHVQNLPAIHAVCVRQYRVQACRGVCQGFSRAGSGRGYVARQRHDFSHSIQVPRFPGVHACDGRQLAHIRRFSGRPV
jgi:hypothetical protein